MTTLLTLTSVTYGNTVDSRPGDLSNNWFLQAFAIMRRKEGWKRGGTGGKEKIKDRKKGSR
jgi:hypothetical protein